MHRFFVACVGLAALTAGLQAQAPPAPKPGPEHANLARFVGTWKMEGKMNPGPMGPGGLFSGTETCRLFEGGFHVVCDTSGSGAMGQMKGHMILTWDPTAKKYRHFAINNTPVAEAAEGTYSNMVWTFKSQMKEAGKTLYSTFTITETSPTSHAFDWKLSDDGKKWATVMEGKATKQN
jgi:hypothetical protein